MLAPCPARRTQPSGATPPTWHSSPARDARARPPSTTRAARASSPATPPALKPSTRMPVVVAQPLGIVQLRSASPCWTQAGLVGASVVEPHPWGDSGCSRDRSGTPRRASGTSTPTAGCCSSPRRPPGRARLAGTRARWTGRTCSRRSRWSCRHHRRRPRRTPPSRRTRVRAEPPSSRSIGTFTPPIDTRFQGHGRPSAHERGTRALQSPDRGIEGRPPPRILLGCRE